LKAAVRQQLKWATSTSRSTFISTCSGHLILRLTALYECRPFRGLKQVTQLSNVNIITTY